MKEGGVLERLRKILHFEVQIQELLVIEIKRKERHIHSSD